MILLLGITVMLGACVMCGVLTVVIRRLSMKFDFVARPRDDRFHRSIVPLGGGVAIFLTIVIFALSGYFAAFMFRDSAGNIAVHAGNFFNKTAELFSILVSALLLHLLGLWDDKKRLKPAVKLFFQFAAALILCLAGGIRVELFIDNIFITTAISCLWIVLVINMFNFLDNMDGLSAGIAAIVASILFVCSLISGQIFVSALAAVFVGALLGFLIFNFRPAVIFMGDAGSLVVGLVVAVLTLKTTYFRQATDEQWYAVITPVLALTVPLYDFLSVTVLRISQGKSPFVGDTQHFSHRLKRRGLSESQIALTLYLATLATGLGAIVLRYVSWIGAVLITVQTIMVMGIIAILEMTGKPHDNAKNL